MVFAMAYDVARVRGLFPSLGDGWIHLDPQAGMQIPDAVATTVSKAFRALVSAPGGVYPSARQSAAVMASARHAVADLVGGDPAGVVLGSGRGKLVLTLAEALGNRIWLGSDVVVTRLDDEENITPWTRMADRVGGRVRWAEVDIESGELPPWQFQEIVSETTSVVAMTLASSTLGTLTDVGAAGEAVHAAGGLLVVDASSAAPYMPLDIEALAADVLILSAERWGGPQVSAMVFRDPDLLDRVRAVSLDPAATGPARLEVDPPQRALLAGLVSSIEHLAQLDESASGDRRRRLIGSLTSLGEYLQRLNFYLVHSLEQLPTVRIVTGAARESDRARSLPIVSLTVDGVSADKVVRRLADNGICALADQPSRALEAIGTPEVGGAVTIGLGPYSTPYEVDQLVRTLASLA
ncbi:cysteine desulfurase-like protein [Gordonia jinhuaensis]|uniref:Aminotransferase/cysteine desulfurase n=2 Tax=Gordonia jinhuaensis TaxID=1517702 RepID=A0A916TJ13_9ACTN|nr:putative aminotransferase/cysteine desulfurase [Gordonia jinhuaensis]